VRYKVKDVGLDDGCLLGISAVSSHRPDDGGSTDL
jgi:hypothetical protein